MRITTILLLALLSLNSFAKDPAYCGKVFSLNQKGAYVLHGQDLKDKEVIKSLTTIYKGNQSQVIKMLDMSIYKGATICFHELGKTREINLSTGSSLILKEVKGTYLTF
jgi:hypothetical protein